MESNDQKTIIAYGLTSNKKDLSNFTNNARLYFMPAQAFK